MAAAATFTTPQLVDKPGARHAMWKYFGFKTMSTVKSLTPKHHCANGVTKHDWTKQLKDKHPDLHKEVRERQVINLPAKKATFSAKSKQRQPPSLSTKVALEKN